MFECVVIFIIPPESKVYIFVLSTTDFRPAYHLANSEDPDEMQHNADFIWVCTDC